MIRKVISPTELPNDSDIIGVGPVSGELYYERGGRVWRGTDEIFTFPDNQYFKEAHITSDESLLIRLGSLAIYNLKEKRFTVWFDENLYAIAIFNRNFLLSRTHESFSVVKINKDGSVGDFLEVCKNTVNAMGYGCPDLPFFVITYGNDMYIHRYDHENDDKPVVVHFYTFPGYISNVLYMGEGIFCALLNNSNGKFEFDILEDEKPFKPVICTGTLPYTPVGNGFDVVYDINWGGNSFYYEYYSSKINSILTLENKGYINMFNGKFFMIPFNNGPIHYFEPRKSVGRRITLRLRGKKIKVGILNDGTVYDRKNSSNCLGKIHCIEKKRNLRSGSIRLIIKQAKKIRNTEIVKDVPWDIVPDSSEDSAKLESALLSIPHLNIRFNLLQKILAFPSDNILGGHVPKNVINLIGFYMNS
jgi:hypothetical protein